MVIVDIKILLIGIILNISWFIDFFGYLFIMVYFNKRSGVKVMVIQRIYFGIKRYLVKIKIMEFQWRQIWGKFDIFFLYRYSEIDISLYIFLEEKCIIKYICEVVDNFDEVLILVFFLYDLVCSYYILVFCIFYFIS